jgi:hypothetical protein
MGEAKPKPGRKPPQQRTYAPNDVRNKAQPPAATTAAPAVPEAADADPAATRLQLTQQLMRAALANDAELLRTAIQHAESVGLSNEAAMARAKLDKLSAAPQQAPPPHPTQSEGFPAAGSKTVDRSGSGQARPRSPPPQQAAKNTRGDKGRRGAKQPAARKPENKTHASTRDRRETEQRDCSRGSMYE